MKKSIKTKVLSLVVSFAIVLSLLVLPIGVHAEGEQYVAEMDNQKFTSVNVAVQKLLESESKSGTITLLKNTVAKGIGLFTKNGDVNVDLTIDFAGNTLTIDDPAVGSTGTETQGLHFEKIIK